MAAFTAEMLYPRLTISVVMDGSDHEYGIVTVQLAFDPERVAMTVAVSSIARAPPLAISMILAVLVQMIVSVDASVDAMVILKTKTSLPVVRDAVAALACSFSAEVCAKGLNAPVRESRYPSIPCWAVLVCWLHADWAIPVTPANRKAACKIVMLSLSTWPASLTGAVLWILSSFGGRRRRPR